MRVVMGEMNGVRLLDLMNGSVGKCSRVSAAVAYATQSDPFFEHCNQQGMQLDYYGLLDEGAAVSVPLLQHMLRAGPLVVNPRLIKGHFHSKIIWWHGYGAYIGSANLTAKAWFTNVECGVFFDESEIIGQPLQTDLEQQFAYLRKHSSPATNELVKALGKLSPAEQSAYGAQQKLKSLFDEATKDIAPHGGLTTYGPATKTTAFTQFTTEWNETLQLLRGLCIDFHKLGKRPAWVDAFADPTVHFDQFLHAYYYVRVRDAREDDENVKTVELVNRAHERNRLDTTGALQEAATWWASLSEAPYGEDVFIRETAPRTRANFSMASLASWQLKDFQDAFFGVHAFKMHARQMPNATLGLPAKHHETAEERSNRVAQWLWEQPRGATQTHIRDLVQFLIWGTAPSNMAERLWLATMDDQRRYAHFGSSTLGEAVGWARPDQYPPRNNRTNKALKALGHDVRLFSD
jgi:PLD-like domain